MENVNTEKGTTVGGGVIGVRRSHHARRGRHRGDGDGVGSRGTWAGGGVEGSGRMPKPEEGGGQPATAQAPLTNRTFLTTSRSLG